MTLDRRTLLAAGIGLSAVSFANAKAAPAPSGAMAGSPSDPLGVRGDFPITEEDGIFLNTAYTSPIPRQVIAAGNAASEHKARAPLSGGENSSKLIRERYARLINADPSEIGLIHSTGEGENLVAWGLGLKSGDNIVMSQLHYDSEFILYRVIEKELGVQFRIAPHRDGKVEVRDMEPFVDKRTKLITVALVSHQNGYVHDLKALASLAHANGAYLFADAVQAAGVVPIDVKDSNIDFMSCNSYKWLLSTGGVTAFYVRRDLFDRLHLDRYGEGQIEQRLGNRQYTFHNDARRFEAAGAAAVPAAQFAASLDYIEKVGFKRISDHSIGLGLRLQRGLVKQGHKLFTPEGNRCPTVSYYIKTDPDEAKRKFMAAAKINVTARDGTVRISPALFNTEAEVDRCLEVAKTIV